MKTVYAKPEIRLFYIGDLMEDEDVPMSSGGENSESTQFAKPGAFTFDDFDDFDTDSGEWDSLD